MGISGFTIVRNGIKQGYPFLETIASVLPMCEEFIVSDGHSTDGTFEVLEKISILNKKVKLFRDEWPIRQRKGGAIYKDISNAARRRCHSDYIFYLQANEVVHEDSFDYLAHIPEMLPKVNTFSLPFTYLLNNLRFLEGFRLRLSKNLSHVEAIDDAWTLGLNRSFVIDETIRNIIHPKVLLTYLYRGMERTYADPCFNQYTRAVYLPKPIFRYYSLFPSNFVQKMKGHSELFSTETDDPAVMLKALEHLEQGGREEFWATAMKLLKGAYGDSNVSAADYPPDLAVVARDQHPKIMRDFISNDEINKYLVRDEVIELIRNS